MKSREDVFVVGAVLNKEARLKIYEAGSGDKLFDIEMTPHDIMRLMEQLWPAVTREVRKK